MASNILHEKLQSAYKACHSTETALLKVQNDILMDMDKKRGVILVLLDLSAAFDTIDHSILLQQLSDRLGITGAALSWFSSYLSARTQSISIDGVSSSPVLLQYSVPQGSVLAPFLYTIYTLPLGDILRKAGVSYHLYADDTQLYLSFDIRNQDDLKEIMDKVQSCVCEIKSWMQRNKLKLNEEKTEILLISSSHFSSKVFATVFKVDDTCIVPKSSVRNIGVVFDKQMSMKQQINVICRSAIFHLRNIGGIRKYINRKACEQLVHAFITSRLDYGNSLLFGLPDIHLKRLQRILHIAARIITLTPASEHITPILKTLHWLPVHQRINYKILLLTFHALNSLAPSYLTELLVPHVPLRNLRSTSQNLLTIPKTSSRTFGDRAFAFAAPTLWNSLPCEMRLISDIHIFKSALKTFLFTNAY